jgi:DNA-directed RNA polymerase specialized sigma24 family protein
MALDEEALTTLIHTELPAIYPFCFHLCGNASDAETLCRSIFISARHKQSNAPLLKIAVHEWKSKGGLFKGKLESKDATSRAFHTLSPDDKVVLYLRDISDKPLNETAALLGISISTAKSRLTRARNTFRTAHERAIAGKRP